MSRVHSASVCSEPKSPGGSRVRSAIAIWIGIRAPDVIEYISYPYVTPTPDEPVYALAPHEPAPSAADSWECSPSAWRYSASRIPSAMNCDRFIMIAVYGRIGYAEMTSTLA